MSEYTKVALSLKDIKALLPVIRPKTCPLIIINSFQYRWEQMSETKTSLKIVVIVGIALKAFSPSNKFVTAYTLAHICFRNGRLACIIQKNNTKEIFHILLQQI